MRCLRMTTSWDDGYPSDIRLAELLEKYSVGGTFYVPSYNCEGRNVLENCDLLEISRCFEIGGHTLDHKELTSIQPSAALLQIVNGKERLEEVLGRAVSGFCYPRGGYNNEVKSIVKSAGFKYARTIKNFFYAPLTDPFEIPTTIQFYGHNKTIYCKNYIKHCSFLLRSSLFIEAMKYEFSVEMMLGLAEVSWENNGCFHIWGHSWELDYYDLWGLLEEVLKAITMSFDVIKPENNSEVYSQYFPDLTL